MAAQRLAWHSIRAAVAPFLGEPLTQLFVSELRGAAPVVAQGAVRAQDARAEALCGFARSVSQSPREVDRCVALWLIGQFDSEQIQALVAFAGAVRSYPEIAGSSIEK